MVGHLCDYEEHLVLSYSRWKNNSFWIRGRCQDDIECDFSSLFIPSPTKRKAVMLLLRIGLHFSNCTCLFLFFSSLFILFLAVSSAYNVYTLWWCLGIYGNQKFKNKCNACKVLCCFKCCFSTCKIKLWMCDVVSAWVTDVHSWMMLCSLCALFMEWFASKIIS